MPTDEITAAAAGDWTLGDRTVHRMGFGSMRITAHPDPALAIRVLRRAVELGVNHVDTAAFYFSPGGPLDTGSGPIRYATDLIRQALTPYPDDLVIATKVGVGHDPTTGFFEAHTAAALRAQVEENLRRLGRNHLDLVNLRIVKRPGRDSIAERFGALAELRAAGLIRHLGLSNVRLDHLDEAQAIAPVVCVQNGYSIDTHRGDDALVRVCADRGIAFVPFFAIAGPRRESGPAVEHDDAVLAVARAHGVTPHQVRLAWTLHQGPHVLAIPGTGDPVHLAENVAAEPSGSPRWNWLGCARLPASVRLWPCQHDGSTCVTGTPCPPLVLVQGAAPRWRAASVLLAGLLGPAPCSHSARCVAGGGTT